MSSDTNGLRIAAVADLHYGRGTRKQKSVVLARASEESDVLLLCGDLTDHGLPEEAQKLVEDVDQHVGGPVFGVFGNHDLQVDRADELVGVFDEGGVQILDGECTTVQGVGFAGVRGFGGGFDDLAVHPFGEPELKEFIGVTVNEALKLETALSRLDTEHRVVLLHYAPVRGTVEGEPCELIAFLGSSRLEDPINHHRATVVFHGHAHKGSPEATTSNGIPVYNVSIPLLEHHFPHRPPFRIFEIPGE